MSTVAQSRDLSDRKTIENFAAVVQSLERMKLLYILTIADIRAVGPGVWNGWKAQLLRTLYYETEPVLDRRLLRGQPRASAWRMAQAEFRAEIEATGRPDELDAYIARHYPAYWLKVDLPHKVAHARFLRATRVGRQAARHQRRLRCRARRHRADRATRPTIRGFCRSSPAPARSPAPTSSMRRSTPRPTGLRSTPSRSRASSSATRTRRGAPRASAMPSRRRCAARSSCPRWWPSARRAKGRLKAFAIEPEVTDQQPMVAPLHRRRGDRSRPARPALRADRRRCRSSTSTSPRRMSRPSANAWSTCSMSPTCSARKSRSPTRQAAIKRPLLALLAAPGAEGRPLRESGGIVSLLGLAHNQVSQNCQGARRILGGGPQQPNVQRSVAA